MAGINENGLMRVKSNDQMIGEQVAAEEAAAEAAKGQEQVVSELAAHCRSEWTRCRDAKQPIEREMLRSMQQREGKYSDSKVKAIRTMGGSEIKMMLTDVKCRAAESIVHDILFGTGERPFSMSSTPIPETPEALMQIIKEEAYNELSDVVPGMMPDSQQLRSRIDQMENQVREKAKEAMDKKTQRMEDHVDDEYQQGDWYEAMQDVIHDFVTLKAGILRGPEMNMQKVLKWEKGDDPAKPNSAKAVVTTEPRRRWYAVSPFDLYPAPESRSFQEGTLIHRRKLAPDSIYAMIGIPGFDEAEIRAAMETYSRHGYSDWLWYDSERSKLEGRPYEQLYDSGQLLDVLECHVKVQGRWLSEWGMDGIEDMDKWYDANCWLLGTYVIRATLNDDPLNQRNYHSDSYVRIRNSPWGRGIPEIMTDLQDMCDSSARAISNNMGIASGPQVEMEVDRLPDGEAITQLHPWKIWQTTQRKSGSAAPAIRFFQPESNAQTLMAVFEFFSNLTDEYTGIPKYQYGDGNVGGAGSTASGLSMLMNASSRLFKLVIRNIDNIIINCTKRMHREIMLHDDDFVEKGDVEVIAKASQALLHREAQQMRVGETLDRTNNEIDFQIMGPKGRLELLRASMRGLDSVDVDKVLPSDDALILQALGEQMGGVSPEDQAAGEGEPTPAGAEEEVVE
jgi:hypothetical protein